MQGASRTSGAATDKAWADRLVFPTLGQPHIFQRSIEVPIRSLDLHRCAASISNNMCTCKVIGALAHPKVTGLLRDGATRRQLAHR
eukprot:7232018-Pyramimonas_sp.AAC.1